MIQAAAFAGGLAAVAIVMLIASRLTAHDALVTLILTGVVVASLLGAGISFTKYVADPYNTLPAITFWLMGSFASSTYRELLAVLVPVACRAGRARRARVAHQPARAAGRRSARARRRTRALRGGVIAAATLATAAAVAVSGIIGWVGLIVPHMARRIAGPEFAPPAAARGGDRRGVHAGHRHRGARALASELPPGILTAIVGTPLFIALLARTRRGF